MIKKNYKYEKTGLVCDSPQKNQEPADKYTYNINKVSSLSLLSPPASAYDMLHN